MLKDIEESDKENKKGVRTIVDICEEEAGKYVQKLLGISYCSLCYSGRKIDCLYISNELDHNMLRICNRPTFGCKDRVGNG